MSTPPLATWELVKMTGPIILFGILLPTVDNLTDLRMIIKLYSGIPDCGYDYIRIDYDTCKSDPATFCEDNPHHLVCTHYQHVKFATMFFGILDPFTVNIK